jgi:beta-glucosidase
VVEAWYPGQEGGHALADVLFGRVNPSGKLTISFPRTVGQLPVFYNHMKVSKGVYHKPGTPDEPGRDYVNHSPEPLYPFGFGLSYTRFKYSRLRVSPTRIAPASRVSVSVDVSNAGKRRGKEVVQLYLRDEVSTVCTPVRTLRGFQKVDLRPGERRTVTFALTPDDMALWDRDMKRVVEPGTFEVSVGGLRKKFAVQA